MACVTREDRTRDGGDLKKQVDIHHDQQDQERHFCDERCRIERHKSRVKEHVKMSKNGHYGCRHNFVKAEPNECSKPSPKQKIEFVDQEERDKERAQQS